MPEYPDLEVYADALRPRLQGTPLQAVRALDPFVVRTVDPPLSALVGQTPISVRRLGKRLAIGTDGDLWLVVHLMVLGRLHFRAGPDPKVPKTALVALTNANGALWLTEAGSKRRASVHLVRGEAGLLPHLRGGLEVMTASLTEFAQALRCKRRTLKRALCDPTVLAAIGNAYSDEILHTAGLSPLQLTTNLDDAEMHRLFGAAQATLTLWRNRLHTEAGGGFPEHVTAFRPDMAVHGRYRQPCPVCAAPVQRIVYADNECNYCARCQTGGRLLADRALSQLLKDSWPRTLDDV
ncbi:MAG: formamidopyrimidine-DNA glycosylase [Deltaproteobacteria bacterium]|nr:formamidopyrimidine-DNA glycosylase [Deltaproteobacteria bacterium]